MFATSGIISHYKFNHKLYSWSPSRGTFVATLSISPVYHQNGGQGKLPKEKHVSHINKELPFIQQFLKNTWLSFQEFDQRLKLLWSLSIVKMNVVPL